MLLALQRRWCNEPRLGVRDNQKKSSVTQWKFNLSSFKLHRHFFLVSYQLLLVSADDGFSKRNRKVIWWSHPSPSFLGLLACVQTPLPAKKNRGERERFFLRGVGGGGCTQAWAYWKWLLPTRCILRSGPILVVLMNVIFKAKRK